MCLKNILGDFTSIISFNHCEVSCILVALFPMRLRTLHSCKVVTSVWRCGPAQCERYQLSLLPGWVIRDVLQQVSTNSLTSLENSECPKH